MNNPMTYIQNGDYLIPDLKLSQQPEKPLGKYGRMRKTYLKGTPSHPLQPDVAEREAVPAPFAEILKTLYHGGNGLGSVGAWACRGWYPSFPREVCPL